MASIGEISAQLTADSEGFISSIGDATAAMGGAGSRAGALGSALSSMGAIAAGAAAAGLAASAAQAAKFERSIAQAAARTGNATVAMREFGTVAQQASLQSEFSARQAAGGLQFLAKSGFDVQEATTALPDIMEGATAAGMGVAEMGEIASNALRAFNRDASSTQDIMDVLVKGSTSANTSVQELGQGISIAGGLASSAGQSIEETVAIIGTLQDAGIGSSRAATALRRALSELQDPSGDTASTLKELGVSARDSEGNFRSMVDIFSDLEAAGADSSDMIGLFGKRAGPTLQTALNQGTDSLREFRSELENSGGTSEKIAGLLGGTLVGQIKTLFGSLKTLATTIGQPLLPILKGLTGVLQTVTAGLVKFGSVVKTIIDVFPEAVGFIEEGKKQTEDLGKASSKTSKQVDKVGNSAEKAAGKVEQQAEAQQELNRSLEDFQNLDLKKQRQAFDELTDRSEKMKSQIRSLRREAEGLRDEFARKFGFRLGNATVGQLATMSTKAQVLRDEIVGTESALKSMRKSQGKVAEKITSSVSASGEMTEEAKKELEATREKIALKETESERERINAKFAQKIEEIKNSSLASERKLAQAKLAQINREEKLIELRKERAKEAKGQAKDEGEGAAAGIIGTAKQTAKDRSSLLEDADFAKPDELGMQQRDAKKDTDLKSKEAADDLTKGLTPAEKKTKSLASEGQKFASSLGRAADNMAKLKGVSDQTANSFKQGMNFVGGILGGIQSAIAATGTLATTMAAATAGISAITGLIGAVAAGSSAAGGGSGGGVGSRGRRNRDRKKFAKMIGEQVGQVIEESERDITRIDIDASGALVGNERQVGTKLSQLIDRGTRTAQG